MHKKILYIAVPSIVSTITVPLLALCDTAIAGHLGAAAYIGAIAVGGMLFNMVYWLFAFLRMGTGGLTAQACGADNRAEQLRLLLRALAVALVVGLTLIAAQRPIANTAFRFITASAEVELGARTYFSILIWGAPAVLSLYAFVGWFLGMQNAKAPMAIAITQNVVNIAASLLLVVGAGWKVAGMAAGTLVAQYTGLFMAVGIFWIKYRQRYSGLVEALRDKELWQRGALSRFFAINRDIFLRTLCLIAVTTYFTAAGSAMGETVLAANALLMQFFILFSYFMDGFAYAAEALGGHFVGARSVTMFSQLNRALWLWGVGLSVGFCVAYSSCGNLCLHLLTNEANVAAEAANYLPAACFVPLCGVAAFLFDGLFIGLTATRAMLLSMATATAAFFGILWLAPSANIWLWTAFLAYLTLRGAVQACLFKKERNKAFASISQQ